MVKLKIRKKDKVWVIAGKDKGKTGEVIEVRPGEMRVLVAKINMITKHTKPRPEQPGGITKIEGPIAYSNVMLVCPKCDKPVRARLKTLQDGEGVRICKVCGETIL